MSCKQCFDYCVYVVHNAFRFSLSITHQHAVADHAHADAVRPMLLHLLL